MFYAIAQVLVVLALIVIIGLTVYLFWPSAIKPKATITRRKKRRVVIDKIIRITPGGQHAWCASNVGVIRKPLNSSALRHLI